MKRILCLISIVVLTCYAIDAHERELIKEVSPECADPVSLLKVISVTATQVEKEYTLISYLS
jgi:hypothetical protein